jgi:hypothetical protein
MECLLLGSWWWLGVCWLAMWLGWRLLPDGKMVHALCILDTKATDTHLEYKILIAFPPQRWFHKCASMLCLYVHCPSWSTMTMLHGLWDFNIHFWSDTHYFTVFPACPYETLPAKQQLDHLCHRVRDCRLIALASELQSIIFWLWHNYLISVKWSVIKMRSVFKCSEWWKLKNSQYTTRYCISQLQSNSFITSWKGLIFCHYKTVLLQLRSVMYQLAVTN